MMYADTDFFLALIKKEDWLKISAKKIYEEYKGSINTSIITLTELALVAKKMDMDIEEVFGSLFQLCKVDDITLEEGMEIAHLIHDEQVGIFDSFHAVLSRGRTIISSERVYEKLGKRKQKIGKE